MKPHVIAGHAVPCEATSTPTCTRIGGQPIGLLAESWPHCRQCGAAMSFLLQLDLKQPIELSKRYRTAYLFTCPGYGDERRCATYYGEDGGNAIVLVAELLASA